MLQHCMSVWCLHRVVVGHLVQLGLVVTLLYQAWVATNWIDEKVAGVPILVTSLVQLFLLLVLSN